AVRSARELAGRGVLGSRCGHRVLTERADRGQLRVLLDLDAPALVLGEMPVEDVELVEREELEVFEHELLRHEVAADIEMAPAPTEARAIFDLDGRDSPRRASDRRAAEDLGWKQLPQRLRAVEDAGRFGRADRDVVGGHGEAIALVAKAGEGRIEPERDSRRRVRRRDRQRETTRWSQLIAQQLGLCAK